MYRRPKIVATSRISLKPPPNIDPTKASLAYGRLAVPRLERELGSGDLLTRQRAIRALCDYLHDPEHIAEAVHGGVISLLKRLLRDPDVPCRAMAAECFIVLNQHPIGRKAFIEAKVYDVMKLLFSLYEPDIVRLNAHRSIELVVLNPIYTQMLVKDDIVPLLIAYLENEFVEIKVLILDTLNKCLAIDTDAGLDANGICIFSKLLVHHDSTIRYKSVQAIFRLVANDRGKIQAIEKETVPRLIHLLLDMDPEVRASAAGALAFICVITRGRYECLSGDAIPNLLRCLLNQSTRVRVNALKALASIGEAPEGRRILQKSLEQIECLMGDESAAVRKHAKIAADVIKWKPWNLENRCRDKSETLKLCTCKY
ncbi:Radial spoke head 14 -like protein [Echinococcus granulosus]|nr:Radial spoke head 14 -like protein [Echinococcus granulosus]